MNRVFSFENGGKKVVLKQGSNRSKNPEVGIGLSRMSPERIADESRALTALNAHRDTWSVRIPGILKYYPEENLILMEDIRHDTGARLMSNPDLRVTDSEAVQLAGALGEFLALQHKVFYGRGVFLRGGQERDRTKWEQAFNLRTTSLSERDGDWDGFDDDFEKLLRSKADESYATV